MTLCIAAECECDGLPAIVMCADWRAQTGKESDLLIGTEDTYKIRDVGGMSVLIAGRPSDAHELLTACRMAVDEFCKTSESDSDIAISAFQTALRAAAGKRKKQLVEEYVEATLGISYSEFRQTRSEFLTDTHHEVWHAITRMDLGADLIFCGFCGATPVIVRLDRFGRSPWETNYTATGEGAEVARAMLCLQDWDAYGPVPLDYCLFRLYEAKTAAHKAHPSSVGAATAFEVIVSGKGRFSLRDGTIGELEEIFRTKHDMPELKSLWFMGRGEKIKKTDLKKRISERKHSFLLVSPERTRE